MQSETLTCLLIVYSEYIGPKYIQYKDMWVIQNHNSILVGNVENEHFAKLRASLSAEKGHQGH